MAQQKTGNIALCPECDGPVTLSGKLHVGQKLTCRRCKASLMIAERKPLELTVINGRRPAKVHVKSEKSQSKDREIVQNTTQKSDNAAEEQPMTIKPNVYVAECPECDSRLRFRKPLKLGQLLLCPECDEHLEVVSLQPLELSWANEAPWDYDDSDDYDD